MKIFNVAALIFILSGLLMFAGYIFHIAFIKKSGQKEKKKEKKNV